MGKERSDKLPQQAMPQCNKMIAGAETAGAETAGPREHSVDSLFSGARLIPNETLSRKCVRTTEVEKISNASEHTDRC